MGSTLLIAKLNRLTRNAGFIFALRDSGVNFVCCDMPDTNTLTVGLFAVLAQHERETISKRTKDALAAKKARRAQLGNPQNMTPAINRQGARASNNGSSMPRPASPTAKLAVPLREKEHTLEQIAAITSAGYLTLRGRLFTPPPSGAYCALIEIQ